MSEFPYTRRTLSQTKKKKNTKRFVKYSNIKNNIQLHDVDHEFLPDDILHICTFKQLMLDSMLLHFMI